MLAQALEKEVSKSFSEVFNRLKSLSLEHRSAPIANRKARLKSLRLWIRENTSLIEQAMYQDFKKPAVEVNATEIFPVLDEIKNALNNLNRWTTPKKVDAPFTLLGTRSSITYEPKGVCLIISPWNYPFNLSAGPLVSALAAGNVVMLKPSENTPHTSALIKKMCEEIFTSQEVVVIEGDYRMAQSLLKLPFDHIFFTGSPAIGKLVMKAAAENLASVTLELGGKSPTIVSPSANINDAAKRIAVTKFINNGQTCIAPDYILVHQSISKEFIDELKNQTLRLFAEGKSFQESGSYARIVNEKHFERLQVLLQDALNKGASVILNGSSDAADKFFHPVILTDVPLEANIMEEEIFGPILPVLTYTSLDDVITMINAKPKPLALYFFGNNTSELLRVKKETSSGAVCVNDCAVQFLHHNIPFGGVNNSGIGKSHGYYGFLAFSNEKPIVKQRNGFTSFVAFYPPYTPRVKRIVNWLIKLF